MSDAYGTLILHTSKDFDGDYDGLVTVLNKFEWNNSCDTWKKYEEANKCYIDLASPWGSPQYPTVFPREIIKAILKDENGAEIIIINPTEAEIEDSWNLIYDDYPSLDRISTELARHIRKGHIEMSCVANEKAHYSYMETLTIRSDGSASRSQTVSRDGTTEEFKEAYPEVAT